MKTLIVSVISIVAALAIGFFVGRSQIGTAPASNANGEREILYYKAPMDSNYRRDQPGKSPMGMDLVPVYADEAGGREVGVVQISPTVISSLGVRTASVQQGSLSRVIETVGYVSFNEDSLHTIATRVDGWIERLAVTATGNPVVKGETLFDLYSPSLVNAQREYLAALRSSNTSLHQASRERLLALGIGDSDIGRLTRERRVTERIRVQAPASGVVAHLSVREGAYVTAASDIMSIGSLNDVWLLVEVFERQATWVAAGQAARIELESLPGKVLEGEVDYVYPELDQKTRTLTARIRLDNSSGLLRPNMFARATIAVSESSSTLHIPLEALIRGGANDRVVVARDNGKFRSQSVSLGIESGDRIEVLSGLSTDDRVVTSGQFLIDSESNIDSALKRLDTPAVDMAGSMAMPMTMPMSLPNGEKHDGHVMPTSSSPDADPHAGHDMSKIDAAPAHEGHEGHEGHKVPPKDADASPAGEHP